ncbi:endoplasmic reticulum metallopeptidase 1 [Aulographum hederae CBS 113979]|uniref:Peptide hydrolase n=1 Tax=Aulographum hederae CBS 113979 TaxID=1176131 RepID=A0A6G1GKM7_9PEZI|nr:endoplasmic reticulum metallopeptidase 1 [Aulographum hederae CBS 113979]
MARFWNPFAFTPAPVQVFMVLVYAALFVSLLVIHLVVPDVPGSTPKSISLDAAWLDLKHLSAGFHPYNSRFNDEVRDWLLHRIDQILKDNGVKYETASNDFDALSSKADSASVILYNDLISNATFSSNSGLSVYFEGTNIIVQVRGTDSEASSNSSGSGGVLVNAHYDSVSSGFGATDDGVGVVTILQLLSFFTTKGQEPAKDIIFLLNNGEEDYLNGARAFMRNPISQLPHTFLNLEGAGAGGRAVLFRSTDTEITKFYEKSPLPFGNVVTADGFKRGLVRSQTDYIIFNGELGMRGLDVAFMAPRSRYHTVEDSTRYTTEKSIWHMLSAALATVQGLSSYTGSQFDGEEKDNGKVNSGSGSEAVWFDLYGRTFAVFQLHTLFAISVTLLVASPVILIIFNIILARSEKWYPFARKAIVQGAEDDEHVFLKGWRGFFRSPISFVIASAAVVGLAFLVTKLNPLIVYSSEYSVWTMMLTAWFFLTWFLMRCAYEVRPTALQRTYTLLWQYIGAFILLTAVTVGENNFHIAGSYFMVIYMGAISVALLISYLEFFALPRKSTFVKIFGNGDNASIRTDQPAPSYSSRPLLSRDASPGRDGSARPSTSQNDADDEATEQTSLLHADRQTFSGGYGSRRRSAEDGEPEEEAQSNDDITTYQPYRDEQFWSAALPSWTWLVQFLIICPIPVILVGQIALLITSSLNQTSADGSAVLLVYLLMAGATVLILAPIEPFIHRWTYHIPTFFLFIFIGTTIYNLTAFPFSASAKLKVYFIQRVDLDTGLNTVSLTGLDGYVQSIISELPSSHGKDVTCVSAGANRAGLQECSWPGIPAAVVPHAEIAPGIPPEKSYASWLDFNATRTTDKKNNTQIEIKLYGNNTRACKILFDKPVTALKIKGSADDPRFDPVGKNGTSEIRLWSREWDKPWTVVVTPSEQEDTAGDVDGKRKKKAAGLDGKVVCLWSDANELGTIPALDEVWRFMPAWSMVSKLSDGLVEGSKAFAV